ncbi:MAG: sugar ABC transporter permease [Acidimicrobiales bacterium]|nr:sugar ABC transporter permease [Acidimicrobiales bacterium]
MKLFRGRYRLRDSALGLLFIAPSMAVFILFAFVPFVRIIGWGTYESRQGGQWYKSVGFSQYWDVLSGHEFREGLWHSFQFLLYTVPAGLVSGVLLALAADRKLRGIKIYQTALSSTIATAGAVAATVFFVLINPVVGIFKVDWLNDSHMAMFGVSLPAIWQNLGLSFVIVLAGLQAIPEEIVEASRLDGYGPVRRLFRITLPMISPVLMFLAVILMTSGIQAFAEVDLLTQGGPNEGTETLLYKVFKSNTPVSIGTGSVMAVGLFVVTAIVVLLQFVILERRVHYD